MIEQSFSILHLEYALAVLIRVVGVMAFIPIIGNNNFTRRPRMIVALAVTVALLTIYPYEPLPYTTLLEYTVILLKELVVGVTIGFTANITMTIISMAGQFVDREIGFSMVSNFDQTFNSDTTITAQFYNMLVTIILLCSNLLYFIISAIADSFELIPVGRVVVDSEELYTNMINYMVSYFTISIRISLPVMIAIMLLNVVLGILAKTAPQMNMFSVGIQLKVFTGLATVFVMLSFLPSVTQFVYNQMQEIVVEMLQSFY